MDEYRKLRSILIVFLWDYALKQNLFRTQLNFEACFHFRRKICSMIVSFCMVTCRSRMQIRCLREAKKIHILSDTYMPLI